MKADAEMNAEEDRLKFELVSARNEADNMCYQMEKMMVEHKDKLTDNDRKPLEAAIEKVRNAAKGENTEAIKSAVKELEQASHAVSKAMYEAAEASQPSHDDDEQPEAAATAAADDDAIDAEFEVKNDMIQFGGRNSEVGRFGIRRSEFGDRNSKDRP